MLALWRDPFAPAMLKQSTDHLGDLRQTRLLAEDAATRLEQALSEGGDPDTLQCLLVGSRLLDYAGNDSKPRRNSKKCGETSGRDGRKTTNGGTTLNRK